IPHFSSSASSSPANSTLSLHDALPILETFGTWAVKNGIKQSYTMVTDYGPGHDAESAFQRAFKEAGGGIVGSVRFPVANPDFSRSEEHTSELQSRENLVCRLLLEKKNK